MSQALLFIMEEDIQKALPALESTVHSIFKQGVTVDKTNESSQKSSAEPIASQIVRISEPSVLDALFEKAKSSELTVFLYFRTDNCNPCRLLSLLIEAEAVNLQGKAFFVQINVRNPKMTGLKKNYKITQAPTIVHVDADRKEIVKINSKPSVEEYINKFKSQLTNSYYTDHASDSY